MDIEDILKNLGLNDKEVRIYLALLPIGSSTASILGKRTGIVRSTAQYTCQQLQKKGLITSVQKRNSLIYTANPPEKLLSLLEVQKKEIQKKEIQVGHIIGDLKKMINPEFVLPKIKFYEGPDGIEEAYHEMMKFSQTTDEILSFVKIIEKPLSQNKNVNTQDYIKHEPSREFIKHRIKHNIKARLICVLSPLAIILKKDDPKDLRKTYLIETDALDFPGGEIFVIKNRIYAMVVGNSGSFMYVAESRSMTKLFKQVFELAWERAAEIDKKICQRSNVKKILNS